MFYPIEKAKGLNDLKDTSIVTPINDDAPVYNSTTQKWENKQITTKEQWQKNGAYNLLPNNGTTQVSYGLTFTFNPTGYKKGVVHVTGTKSDSGSHGINLSGVFNLKAGTYKILDGLSNNNLGISLIDNSTSTFILQTYNQHEATFTLATDTEVRCTIVFFGAQNTTFDDYIYPMITTDLTAVPITDYEPHAKTNRELTEELGFGAVGASLVSTFVDTSAGSTIGLKKWGHICLLTMQIKTTSSLVLNIQQTIATIPSGYMPKYNTFDTTYDKGYERTNESHDIEIDTNGNIKLTLRNTHSNVRWVCATMAYICE